VLTNVIIISLVVLIVHSLLRRDFDKGLAAAVFFLILLPKEVQIDMPGALPELTGHRVVLLVLLANMLPRLQRVSLAPVSRLLLLLGLIAVCRLFSTITAIDSAASFKVVLGFLIEIFLYFVLVAGALNERRTIEFVAWSSLLALVLIAGIGTIEKYTGRNLVAMIVPGMNDSPTDVSATFRHRILFGYAMAMGFPLALGLKGTPDDGRWKRWLPKIGMVLLPAACYFSNSRGPWVGCGLAGLAMGTLGGRPMRRKLMLLGALTALVLALRPGTYDTIVSLWHQSFNDNTIKGRSADYRLVLWRVAYDELTKSFDHTLFGYGGHSTEMLDVSKYFDRGAGGLAGELGYTSWDSQYASNFMQYGFLGFGLEAVLYLSVLGMLVRTWRQSDGEDREFTSACATTALVFFWAMATVAIFNPQLDYLFWTVVAIAGRFHSVTSPAELHPELNEDVRMEAPSVQASSEIGI
jgi:hypothetical protein